MSGVEALSQDVLPIARPEVRSSTSSWFALALAVLIFGGLSLTAGLMSDGFLEADACTHYLYARFAFQEPHYFANVWGRPLCTGVYAIPAAIAGRAGVRVASLIIALAIGAVAMRIARLQNYRWPALALIFTLAQPLVFLHSFSELTELPFALLIACAFWAYRARQFWLMALLIGLSPLGRPEGFGFIGLAALALVAHRKWQWLPLLVLPMIGWNHLGWLLYGRPGAWWRWLPDNWPYAPESLYAAGHPLHFVVSLPVIVSPLIFPAMLIGIGWSFGNLCRKPRQGATDGREPEQSTGASRGTLDYAAPTRLSLDAIVPSCLRPFFADHVVRCQVLIAVLPLLILVGHSALYAMGKMASNGELRYMLVVAPFWGLLSAKGWECVFTKLEWRRPMLWAGIAALLPIFVNFYWQVIPLTMSDDWHFARTIARRYENGELRQRYPYVCASHPAFYYFLDISPSGPRAREWHKSTIASPPDGTILIWDPVYGVFNSDANRSIPEDAPGQHAWMPSDLIGIDEYVFGGQRWNVWTSPRDANGAASQP